MYTENAAIVNTYEFDVFLPGVLFRYGTIIIYCMLSVSDCVIIPNICIERKFVSDLIGSLQKKSLVTQCRKMVQIYKYPTSLIVFDQRQSFSLELFNKRRINEK